MSKDEINAWILARKAEGLWVRACLSCGSWFAQPHNGRPGTLCNREVCVRAYRYQQKNGAMPPDWLWRKWRDVYGGAERKGRSTSSVRLEQMPPIQKVASASADAREDRR